MHTVYTAGPSHLSLLREIDVEETLADEVVTLRVHRCDEPTTVDEMGAEGRDESVGISAQCPPSQTLKCKCPGDTLTEKKKTSNVLDRVPDNRMTCRGPLNSEQMITRVCV